MKETRRLVREDRLQKFVRLLSGRYYINVHLPEQKHDMFKNKISKPTYYGFCDTKSNIYINPKTDNDSYENLILQKAISLHELGHILYTDGDLWKKSGVSHGLMNIIEDGRVEEAISRDYPKARKYFFYLYNKLSQPSMKLRFAPTKLLTIEFLLRTAKKTTGIPPLPKNIKKKLKKKLKNDYYWLGSKTRSAVFAPTEEDAIIITKEIQDKLKELFKDKKSRIPDICKTPSESIYANSTKNRHPKNMPPPRIDPISDPILNQERKELNPSKTKDKDEKNKSENKDKPDQTIKQMKDDAKKEIDKEKATSGIHDEKSKEKEKLSSDKKDEDKDKNAKDVYNEINKEIKKEIEEEAKNEYNVESKEVKTNKSNAKFDAYDIHKTKKLVDGEAIPTASLEPIANRIVHSFKLIAQKGTCWKRNQIRGKIDSSNLYRVYSSKNDNPRVFKNQKLKDKTDLSAVVLLDASSSMCGDSVVATKTTYVIARALEIANFNVEVIAFGVKNDSYKNHLYGLKSFNQSLQYAKQRFIPRAIDGTPLYPGLVGAQKSLENMTSKRKIIIVITDGEPNECGGPYECKQKIKEIEKDGISVVGILIKTKDRNDLFLPTNRLSCNDIYELPNKMSDIIKNVLLSIKR